VRGLTFALPFDPGGNKTATTKPKKKGRFRTGGKGKMKVNWMYAKGCNVALAACYANRKKKGGIPITKAKKGKGLIEGREGREQGRSKRVRNTEKLKNQHLCEALEGGEGLPRLRVRKGARKRPLLNRTKGRKRERGAGVACRKKSGPRK